MHSRRIACFIVGMWLAGGLMMFWLGREAAWSAGRTLDASDPNVAVRVQALGGREEARLLLHHAAAEQYRHETALWEIVQIFLGGLFFLFLLFGTEEGKVPLAIALLLIVIVAAERFLLTPEVRGLGRLTDFPSGALAGARVRLLVLKSAYAGFEFTKWGLQLVLLAILVGKRPRSSRHSGDDLNVVDKADYRHIDR